jgi:hypothetical protein
MARIIRLLWRLDFDVSYPYLDKRGSALKVLTDTIQGFWTNVGPGQLPLSFAAEKTEDQKSSTTFSWEMTCLNGATEWAAGIDIDRVFDSPLVRSVDRIVKDALKLGEVRVVKRAGVRVFCVEKFAKKKEQPAADRVGRLVDAAEDVAFIYEGTTDDGLGYRAQFGPYATKNPGFVFLKEWGEFSKQLDENDLFFDIDIFQTNFSFEEHSLYRWPRQRSLKLRALLSFVRRTSRSQGLYPYAACSY